MIHPTPVALFCYARPEHTRRTLHALAANELAGTTDVYAFADGPRSERDAQAVAATREVLRDARGFRSLEIIERETNLGLAKNISDGVGRTIALDGTCIVVEDDIVTARSFLRYMNMALAKYRDEPEVWHIAGWNYPIDPAGLPEAFFWRAMNCWGWATWEDRWAHFGRDTAAIGSAITSEQTRYVNLDGATDFFSQFEDNARGRTETWAIFWYLTIAMRKGLCLNPTVSLVENIGLDGSGEHCGLEEAAGPFDYNREIPALPTQIEEHQEALGRIQRHLRLPLHRRAAKALKRSIRNFVHP